MNIKSHGIAFAAAAAVLISVFAAVGVSAAETSEVSEVSEVSESKLKTVGDILIPHP